ncbi:MAG: hypothetical protein ACI9V1_000770 [Spirosomataceae bacterium]
MSVFGQNDQCLSDMEDTDKAKFEALYTKYLIWKSSQENQTDGYDQDGVPLRTELCGILPRI